MSQALLFTALILFVILLTGYMGMRSMFITFPAGIFAGMLASRWSRRG